MSREVIIACDFDNQKELRSFLSNFKKAKPFLKIGYQLFYATGSELISQLIEEGYDIFLDLKLCDIPNTVEHGIKNLARLGVKFITIHASGGIAMMSAAVKGASGTNAKLLAVTQLTSVSQQILESELLIERKLSDVVEHYATNALTSGVHGVICSV
jgi:orotidine-5'-phosphate decarboxylase